MGMEQDTVIIYLPTLMPKKLISHMEGHKFIS